jgi:hypothetical protein
MQYLTRSLLSKVFPFDSCSDVIVDGIRRVPPTRRNAACSALGRSRSWTTIGSGARTDPDARQHATGDGDFATRPMSVTAHPPEALLDARRRGCWFGWPVPDPLQTAALPHSARQDRRLRRRLRSRLVRSLDAADENVDQIAAIGRSQPMLA